VLGIDAASPGVRFAWWTLGKVITWLGPTFMFLRRAGVASASWLGLSTARGLRAALLWSAAWLAFQNGCEMLQISVVTRDAPPDNYYALAGPLLVAPCFEEILFRGAMLRLMRAWGYRRDLVVWTSALAFTVLHLPGWIFRLGFSTMLANLFAGIMFFGLAAGYLAWRVPTLWGPIALHFLNNLWTTRALDVVMKELGA
jgi:membrane protease YdiL (CAAX protease family)